MSLYITAKLEAAMITPEYIMSCFAKILKEEMPTNRVPALKTAMELIQPKGRRSKEVAEIERKSKAEWGEPDMDEVEDEVEDVDA